MDWALFSAIAASSNKALQLTPQASHLCGHSAGATFIPQMRKTRGATELVVMCRCALRNKRNLGFSVVPVVKHNCWFNGHVYPYSIIQYAAKQ